MGNKYITDIVKLSEQLSRFTAFVHYMNKREDYISFRDSTGFLGREEDYKSLVAEEARKELGFKNWKESWIGSGKISDCVKKAMNKADNLVNKYNKTDFQNRLDPANPKYHPEAEQILFDIYRNPERKEESVFSDAIKTFGGKYDVIAYLFFIKDDTRFLPISSGHFDKGFAILGIDYTTAGQCGWENYQGFIGIIQEIRDIIEDILPMRGAPRLIDAHSFVWVIQQDRFINWIPALEQSAQIEQTAEDYAQNVICGSGGRRKVSMSAFIRNAEVVNETRNRANGVCQYCNRPAPFVDKKGNPYLEVHHVIWLSRGGEDSTDNTVALCPNCHKRMHMLDMPEDIEKLKGVIHGELVFH